MKNVLTKVSGVAHKIQDYVLTGSLALGTCMCTLAAHADANEAITETLKIVGKIVCIPGLFFLVFGLIHYAEARSEGDGPAKNKAMQQISAGVMVLLVGIILHTNGVANIVTNFLL